MQVIETEYAKARVSELEQICAVRPSSGILADLAACYFTIGEPEAALPLAQRAWELNRRPETGMNLALILKDLGRHQESCKVIEAAYQLNPEDAYVQLGYGEALLRAGFWKQAWPVYDNARPTQLGAALYLKLPQAVREWDGGPLPEGHELLVINEGGTGDRLSYPRWLSELTKRGINWKFYPYAELFSFFERILPRNVLAADGDKTNPTHWTTSFALLAKLNVGPTEIPEPLLYCATEESIAKYKFNRTDNLPVVGLCYEAAEKFQGGKRVRSLTPGQAMRLVTMTGSRVHWVNLQHGIKMDYPVSNIPFQTWEDTCGLIHNLDAVVTVDTGTMHLAGSMKKPMSVLLGGNSCWKFGASGSHCKLYPTAKLYRNETQGFDKAIDNLILSIRNNEPFGY